MEYSAHTLWIAFSLTLLAGLSTGIGAAMAFFSGRQNKRLLSAGLGFSAGVMIYVSFGEIMVQSKASFALRYSDATAEGLMQLCFFAGIGIAFLIDRLVPDDVNPHELKSSRDLKDLKAPSNESDDASAALHRTGVFTAVAIAIHNFPEGFATFVASLGHLSTGIMIAVAIAIHNIPEGMAVSLPIYHATGDRRKAFWYAFLSGLVEPLGAVIGFLVLMPFMGELTMGITFGAVAGIMVYICLDELLPAARIYGSGHTAIGGVVAGMALMASSLLLFKYS